MKKFNILVVTQFILLTAKSEISVEYDLLIIGTPKHNDWASILFGTGQDKFVKNSACSVLRLTIKN